MTSEADLKRSIIGALERLPGVIVMRLQSGSVRKGGHTIKMGEKGTPDLQVLLPAGRTLFIETKAPKTGRLSDEQREWHERAARIGHRVIVSSDLHDVVAMVTREWHRADAERTSKLIDC